MTNHNENTPVTAPTVNEGNELLGTGSSFTAYLPKHGDNTRHAYGTFSGEPVPMKDNITMILPVDAVVHMMDEGPVLVQINPGCLAKHNEYTRQLRAKRAAEKARETRRRIASRIEEEEGFKEKLDALDQQATAIYDQIDARVDAILNNEEMAP